jgi:hypothetical protein
VRRLLRQLFLVGPCRLYLRGEATGGSVPFVFIVGLFAVAAAIGGVFALVAVVVDASAADYFFIGALAGLGLVIAWIVYVVVVLAVLWLRGISPSAVPGVLPAARSNARHAAITSDDPNWRRRGDPLVPRSLVAFFALTGAVFLADGIFTVDQGVFDGDLATTSAEVVRYDDGPGGFGERELVVRFTAAGREITTKVKAEDRVEESRVPAPGGRQDVEYVVTDPARARPAGATQANRDDAHFSRVCAYVCWSLAALTGVAYLVGRRRSRRAGRDLRQP